ncbi:serine hydrolase domain-containing protein [Amycolatopsis jejuensis]|uniref:serine hydrolase domain-containing protein n=1 Tax=Amycolatopsis jejuensis TaxID=330084 RepID=UPI000525F3F5|nr:serine hydrolase domain-containing protein [Amycolatopsis jejuensis]
MQPTAWYRARIAIIGTVAGLVTMTGGAAVQADPDPHRADLQQALDAALDRVSAPGQGVQAVLLKEGRIVWSANRGMAIMNLHPPKRVDDSTMFNYGSFGKLVLGAYTLRQVELGKLNLDEPIAKYVGNEIAGANVVTIRMLLSHTAGYHNVYAAPETISLFAPGTEGAPIGTAPVHYDPNTPFTFEKLNAGIHEPDHPGTKFAYENTNYLVLYRVLVERLGGLDAVQRGITEFLAAAGAAEPEDGTQITQDRYAEHTLENMAHGYQPLDHDRGLQDYNTAYGAIGIPVDSMGYPFGDGAFGGTALGAAQVLDALFVRGALLQASTVAEMKKPTEQSLRTGMPYGLATMTNEFAGRTWKGHPGGFTGFTSTVYTDLGTGATLAVVTNRSGTDADSDQIWEELAKVYTSNSR